jgi:hypothetical protein
VLRWNGEFEAHSNFSLGGDTRASTHSLQELIAHLGAILIDELFAPRAGPD